jgi:hypothetical protein
MATAKQKLNVIQADDVDPVPVEIIAQDIQRISEAMEKIDAGRLNRTAIIILVQANTGMPRSSINAVLNSLADLKHLYLKK